MTMRNAASIKGLVLRAAAYVRAGLEHLRRGLILVLLEVLHEQLAELLDFALEVGGAVPRLGRVEELVGHVGTRLGHGEAECVVGLEFDLCELTRVDGIEDSAGVLERATFAAGGSSSTDPAGVEQPGVGLVLFDLLGKHLGVAHGVQGQEGLGKARGEGSLRLGHTLLGTSHLRSVSRDEVVHGLLLVELGDGR